MSNRKTKTPISKATKVAEDIIQSEVIITSTNEASNNGNKDDIEIVSSFTTREAIDRKESSWVKQAENTDTDQQSVVLTSTVTDVHQDKLSVSTEKKKASSQTSNQKKTGPSATMINAIRERQKARIEAEIKAEEATKEKQRRQQEAEEQEQKNIWLEAARRQKKKEKTKRRIQRQREEGSYLTKGQREKQHRTRVQLEAAGIQIPERIDSQPATSNSDAPGKKRILYDNRPKANPIPISTPLKSIELENKMPLEVKLYPLTWECDFAEEKVYQEELHNQHVAEGETTDDHQSIKSQESSESESTDSDDDDENDQSLSLMECVRHRLERRHEICELHRSSEILRAPIICVLGHVDAGKTTILDNLRRTHVQTDEAGGITQQIGATNVPLDTLLARTKMCREIITCKGDFKVPGLLIIDTPGHAIFQNLRSRGSSLCDLAILVVDIMHGLKAQTIESIQLLKKKQIPFIIALNKIDLLYKWKSDKTRNIENVLQEQDSVTQNQFEKRCNDIIVQFAEQGLNVALYYKNPDPHEYYSMVPISAHSDDGMGSLIAMIIETSQTSLAKRISYTDELQASIMEVKSSTGLGTAIDVVLVNGCLSVGDKIIVAGHEGPIVTQIRSLLIPKSNQELRVTNQYENKRNVKGACGVKIIAKYLEKSVAGLPLFVARQPDEIDHFKAEIELILRTALNSIKLDEHGVCVQASTLGSLEAFVALLRERDIPCSGVNIGPVHRRDIVRASTQLEKNWEWATILAFDVPIERDAQEYAKEIEVKILQNDEIYRLCDMFISYRKQRKDEIKDEYRHLTVFPCKLKILPTSVFRSRDPIVCGVRIEEGFIRLGTPICVPSRDSIELGRITSIEFNNKPLEIARKGSEVCIKIISATGETPKMYGRHFDENDILMSKISRKSIDILKDYFRDEMQKSDWQLVIELKKIFNIE